MMVSVMATTTMAAVDCKPFKEEAKVKNQIVADFSYELEKLEKKVMSIENKMMVKISKMDSVQDSIDQAKSSVEQIEADEAQLSDSISVVEMDIQKQKSKADDLIHTIEETQYQISNLPSRSHARRQIMRENNRAKKILEKVDQKINMLSNSIEPQKLELEQLVEEKMAQVSIVNALKVEKMQIAKQKPTIGALTKRKANAEAELVNQDVIQQENISLANEAQEKVLMCKTYNVKYPVALEVAKELYTVGCENYQTLGMKGKHKQDAESEVVSAVCD